MKLSFKIAKWVLLIAAGLLMVLFSLSLVLKDKVVPVFINAANKRIQTKVHIGSYNLSLIRKFPRASVELKEVTVLSSMNFNRSQFPDINTDTLLYVKSAWLEFSMLNLIKGNYNIESITLREGILGLFSDSSGMVNYDITEPGRDQGDEDIVINLEKIIISGMQSHYINQATRLNIEGLMTNGRIRSRIAGNQIDFSCFSEITLRGFDLYSSHLKTDASITVDMDLQKSDAGVEFKKGSLEIDNLSFKLSGIIEPNNNLDLRITGNNIDLARIKDYLPDNYEEQFGEFSPKGMLKTEVNISGIVNRKENPNIYASFFLENGNIFYKKSGIKVEEIYLSGFFTNGRDNNPETTRLEITRFDAKPGKSVCSGSFSIVNFKAPAINLNFSGTIIPSELLDIINLPAVSSSDGSFRLNLKAAGDIERKKKYVLSDFIKLHPEGNIQFNSFNINIKNNDISIDDANGNLMFSKHIWADDLSFTIRDQRFKVTGEFRNFPAWLAGQPVRISVDADVSAGDLNPELLMSRTSEAGKKGEAVKFPDDIDMAVNFEISNFTYKDFFADEIKGNFIYNPGIINLNSFIINSMGGSISGNCLLGKSVSSSFITQGNFKIENVDVNKAFLSFRNFGQSFIVADNLEGTLSGNLSLLMPLDSVLHPDTGAITADGKYVITNGVLKEFEPVTALSRFIEISELEKITFSRLENDLFIRNNYLAVPQMDIKSSAADFSVSGTHDFNNNYEYHVKAYLSEILSKKAGKARNSNTEFGAVEEDGLGRTSVYLKISGNDNNLKVAYDFKAAGNNIKESLNNEKSTLKNILNEEYGLFKGDTTLKHEPAPKPRFRIEFEETIDTLDAKQDTLKNNKESLINRIFKKKKGLDL